MSRFYSDWNPYSINSLSTGTLGGLDKRPTVPQFDMKCENGWKKIFYYKKDNWNGSDLLVKRRNKMHNGWYIGPCVKDGDFQLQGTYLGEILIVEKEKRSAWDDRMRVWRSELPSYFFVYGDYSHDVGIRHLKCWDHSIDENYHTHFQLEELETFLQDTDPTKQTFQLKIDTI